MNAHGFCNDGFEAVQQAFEANFEQGKEVGASICVTQDGETVVDLWGGDADGKGQPWKEDTIVNVYSTTKTMAATCILILADRAELDLHAPVAQYWPEFAQAGKEEIKVAHIMSHSSGLSDHIQNRSLGAFQMGKSLGSHDYFISTTLIYSGCPVLLKSRQIACRDTSPYWPCSVAA